MNISREKNRIEEGLRSKEFFGDSQLSCFTKNNKLSLDIKHLEDPSFYSAKKLDISSKKNNLPPISAIKSYREDERKDRIRGKMNRNEFKPRSIPSTEFNKLVRMNQKLTRERSVLRHKRILQLQKAKEYADILRKQQITSIRRKRNGTQKFFEGRSPCRKRMESVEPSNKHNMESFAAEYTFRTSSTQNQSLNSLRLKQGAMKSEGLLRYINRCNPFDVSTEEMVNDSLLSSLKSKAQILLKERNNDSNI